MASNVIKCTGCNLVICEVLAYVIDKLDVMDEDSLSRICVTAFTSEDITSAKKLLWDSIPVEKRIKFKTRKGDKKTQRDIDDIFMLLKQAIPGSLPIFVARDLKKLPPITFDHVDVTRLLKDILVLKHELKSIQESYVTVDSFSTLKKEVEGLKSTQNDPFCNINTKRGTYLRGDCEFDSGPMGLQNISQCSPRNNGNSPNNNEVPNSPCLNTYRSIEFANMIHTNGQNGVNNPLATSIPRMSGQLISAANDRADVAASTTGDVGPSGDARSTSPLSHNTGALTKTPMLPTPTTVSNAHAEQQMCAEPVRRSSMAEIVKAPGQWNHVKCDEEWKLVERKRLKNRIVGKSGIAANTQNGNFKAAVIKIPLFIYNVDKSATESDISKHIYSKSQINVPLQKLAMKNDRGYDAYKITA